MKFQKKKTWKYRVFENQWYDLYHNFGNIKHDFFQIVGNRMLIKAGYHWDGATGIPDTKKNYVPSCIHDVLAQCMREGLMPIDRFKDANHELKLQYKERGGWSWWGSVLRWGTNTFGKRFFKSDIIEVK